MTHLDEITLRKAATWQAFKEGEKWLTLGHVGQLASIDGGWRGVVHAGKRRLGVRIRIHSQSDIEVNCACAENQSTGACCSHAVAVALAAIRNTASHREKPAGTSETTVNSHAFEPITGWDLQLAQNWDRALSRGVLVALASRTCREKLQASDSLVQSWISTGKTSDQSPIHLQTRGDDAANLLRAMAGNEGFAQEGSSKRIEVSIGDLIQLEHAEPIGNAVQLDASPMPDRWLPIGDTLVRVESDGIHLAGAGKLPAAIRKSLEMLISTAASARVPIRDWILNLSLWQDWVALPEKSWLNELQFIPASAAYHLELNGTPSSITAQLRVAYRDCKPVPIGTGEIDCLPHLDRDHKKCELRDTIGETAARQRLIHIGFHADDASQAGFQLNGTSQVTRFLAIQLPDLAQDWHVNVSADLQRHREQITLIRPQIESIDQACDSTDFRLVYRTSEGALIPDEAIRKMLRVGSGLQKTPQNQILCLDVQSTKLLDDLLDDLELVRSPGVIKAKSCAADLIRSFQKGTWSGNPISNLPDDDFRPPSTIEATLRPYQLHGSRWLVDRMKRYGGAVLADDMGLGKTLQAIVCIEHLIESMKSTHGPSLIVASTSLLGNWQAEYARFAPHRSVRVMHGAQRDSVREALRPRDVIITSYGTLVRDLAWHLRQSYHVVVADEASLMRNPDTDHARAMTKLRCDYRIALSGTPVENSLRDLWSIFRFVQPGWLGSRSHFKERYELRQNPSPTTSHSLEVLKIKTSPFILRRTKQQVAPELPKKIEIDEICELSADQQQVYRSLIEEGRRQVEALREQRLNGAARMRMLTLLLRLRQTCCDLALLNNEQLNSLPVARRSSKLERLINLLDEARNGGHKTLVFSQFSTQLLAIESQIQSLGWRSLRLDGSTRNRQELVEQFQSDDGPEIFLISLKAGGYGLNLTAADTVVHFDPWWNPAAEAQASDRAHRIGQTRPVSIYRLLTRNTVEEKVVKMQADKRGLARAIDESGVSDAGPSWLDDPERLRAIFES